MTGINTAGIEHDGKSSRIFFMPVKFLDNVMTEKSVNTNLKEDPPADMQKTSTYFRTIVAFHNFRDRARETAESWQERGLADRLHDGWNNTRQTVTTKTKGFFKHPEDVPCEHIPEKYNYVFRPKSRWELILLSGTVCGIEFCYAAETAFVTPILLSLGLSIKFVTMIWCLSPLVGLFLTPILGSMSDSCESKFGRRRPFIIMYSIGILLGLILVPNGHHIGLALGDKGFESILSSQNPVILNGTSMSENNIKLDQINDLNRTILKDFYSKDFDETNKNIKTLKNDENLNTNTTSYLGTMKKTLPGQNAHSHSPEIKNDNQNYDALQDENETNSTEINGEFSDPTNEFAEIIQKDDNTTIFDARHDDLKSPKNKNKYPRQIDDADNYPNIQFNRMNTENRDYQNDSAVLEKSFDEDEKENTEMKDEFSNLIEKEDIIPDEKQDGITPLIIKNKYSRKIDDADYYPSHELLRMNKNLNTESEKSNSMQTIKSDILEDEFSRLLNKENINSDELQWRPNLTNKYSRSIDEEDILPNLQFSRRFLKNLSTESENNFKFTETKKSDIFTNEDSQLKTKENGNSDELSLNDDLKQMKNVKRFSQNPIENIQSQEIDGDDVYPNFSSGQSNKRNLLELQYKNRPLEENSDNTLSPSETKSDPKNEINNNQKDSKLPPASDQSGKLFPDDPDTTTSHIQTWSVVFTVIGTVLLDFCSDACQSPSRTYLLDVSLPSDHAAGLSTFTVMAGFGGAIGYAMGALHWERTSIGQLLGGQVNAVFMIVTVIFLICLVTTVTSFPEIPLSVLKDPKMYKEYTEKFQTQFSPEIGNELNPINIRPKRYGSTDKDVRVNNEEAISDESEIQNSEKLIENKSTENGVTLKEMGLCENIPDEADNAAIAVSKSFEIDFTDELGCANERPTLKEYLKSIIHMPNSLRVLCLTNLFCWMSLVCYSLYFTDFVGECVFGGDPQAPEGSASFLLYQNGVQFGCWGMALYSTSCSIYSLFIESLVKKVGARPVYIGGQLVYSVGMVVMAITRHKVAVILLSPTAGIMYSTLFTMPYLLIAHYHCNNQFSDGKKGSGNSNRGIGTDVAAVSSMVFLSQFILSLSMGSIVEAVGSNVVPVCAAALLSACGAIAATRVTYLDI